MFKPPRSQSSLDVSVSPFIVLQRKLQYEIKNIAQVRAWVHFNDFINAMSEFDEWDSYTADMDLVLSQIFSYIENMLIRFQKSQDANKKQYFERVLNNVMNFIIPATQLKLSGTCQASFLQLSGKFNDMYSQLHLNNNINDNNNDEVISEKNDAFFGTKRKTPDNPLVNDNKSNYKMEFSFLTNDYSKPALKKYKKGQEESSNPPSQQVLPKVLVAPISNNQTQNQPQNYQRQFKFSNKGYLEECRGRGKFTIPNTSVFHLVRPVVQPSQSAQASPPPVVGNATPRIPTVNPRPWPGTNGRPSTRGPLLFDFATEGPWAPWEWPNNDNS